MVVQNWEVPKPSSQPVLTCSLIIIKGYGVFIDVLYSRSSQSLLKTVQMLLSHCTDVKNKIKDYNYAFIPTKQD